MATNTYVALDKITVSGSSTTSITFSSIPSTYTDLVIVASTRDNRPSSVDDGLSFRLNNDSGSNYSETFIYGNGSTAASIRTTNSTFGNVRYIPGSTAATGDLSTTIIHLMNYSNATTYKTLLSRSGSGSSTVATNVNLWRSTSAINQITFYGGSPTTGYVFTAGTTFSLYGIAAEGMPYATGGYVTSDANYYYHTFKSTGTFTPLQSLSCDVLAIAGGGAGTASGNYAGGGGGAGGLLFHTAQSVTATNYTVTIGAGGALGSSGSNTSFGALTASVGGGVGGVVTGGNGGSGGSGGGGGSSGSTNGTGGTATSGQGFAGGNGGGLTASHSTGGGGGGAGAIGSNGNSSQAGNGGAGVNTYSAMATATNTGVSGYYAGGGGGGSDNRTQGTGGSGGAGSGTGVAGVVATSATANTGSGGGGGAQPASGGSGGSGLVIVRYAK